MKKTIFAACAVLSAAALHAATPQASLDAAIIPGADIVGWGTGTHHDSQFYKQVDVLSKKFDAEMMARGMDAESAAWQKKFTAFETLMKNSGFSDENFDKDASSVNFTKYFAPLEGLLKEPPEPKMPSVGDIQILVAQSLKNPVADDLVQKLAPEIIAIFSDGKPFPYIALENFTHAGAKCVRLTVDIPVDDLPFPFSASPEISEFLKFKPFAAAVLGENKVVYVGTEEEVKAAIDRANAGQKTGLTPEIRALVEGRVAGKNFLDYDDNMAWVFPDVFRKGLAKLEQIALSSGRLPPGMAPALDAAKNSRGIRLVLSWGDTLDLTLNIVLDTPERAAGFRDFMDINALNMAKMLLFQARGKNTPLADSLKAVADGDSVSIKVTVGVGDVEDFFGFIQKFNEESPFLMNDDEDEDWD